MAHLDNINWFQLCIFALLIIEKHIKQLYYESKTFPFWLRLCCFGTGVLEAQTYQVPVSEKNEKMQEGEFEPTWESLQNYKVPEWFRNAKFGIWAHWGPQCVEGSGDWMARSLYLEGSREYKHHVEHYGHPSEVGFKDILPLFKAEKWDPDKLVSFYKKIGAQYFFALGNHHDNYDLWDSQYQEWNSVNIGPKKDILRAGLKQLEKRSSIWYQFPCGPCVELV